MDRLNFKNYDTDVKFVSSIEAKGLEYPEAPKGGREMTAVEGFTRSDLMVPEVAMVVPTMFMGEGPVVVEKEETKEEDESEPVWGGDVTLEKNYSLKTPVVLGDGQSCTVNLNGKAVTGPVFAESNGEVVEGNSDSYVFWTKGGELVIEGNGRVEAQDAKYSMAVWAQGGKVTINGGEFYNHGDGCDLIYASNGGQVEIHGGEFHATERSGAVEGTQNKFSALNIKDKDRETSSIKVFGGKFFGFDPANNLSEGPNTNFVAEGYKSVEVETGVWEVMPE